MFLSSQLQWLIKSAAHVLNIYRTTIGLNIRIQLWNKLSLPTITPARTTITGPALPQALNYLLSPDCICQLTGFSTVRPSVFRGFPQLLWRRVLPFLPQLFIVALIYFLEWFANSRNGARRLTEVISRERRGRDRAMLAKPCFYRG